MARSPFQSIVYDDGELHVFKSDVRRPNFECHHRDIKTVADFKATLRAGSSTDLGGYPLFFITSDGAALSFEAAQSEVRQIMEAIRDRSSNGWHVVACDVNYEDNDLYCDHTNKKIDSAYGSDESDETDE